MKYSQTLIYDEDESSNNSFSEKNWKHFLITLDIYSYTHLSATKLIVTDNKNLKNITGIMYNRRWHENKIRIMMGKNYKKFWKE